jgi:hypothetical protein
VLLLGTNGHQNPLVSEGVFDRVLQAVGVVQRWCAVRQSGASALATRFFQDLPVKIATGKPVARVVKTWDEELR